MNTGSFLIAILPLLALVLALLFRCYPGERAIEKLRGILASSPVAFARCGRRVAGLPVSARTVRGGRLIACSLAGRAPPFRT